MEDTLALYRNGYPILSDRSAVIIGKLCKLLGRTLSLTVVTLPDHTAELQQTPLRQLHRATPLPHKSPEK